MTSAPVAEHRVGGGAAVHHGWRVVGATVRGASHTRADVPNQDAIGWWPPSGVGPPLAIAVADGHGGDLSFRSHVGSQLAVAAALEQLRLLDPQLRAAAGVSGTLEEVGQRLARAVVDAWKHLVTGHVHEHPLTEDEERLLRSMSAETLDPESPYLVAYGSTLLAMLATERVLLLVQLGDGDVVCVDADGTPTRPWPSDPRLVGNETTSLCLAEAWRAFRVHVSVLDSATPRMVLLSTDGYANSFASDTDFLQCGPDFRALVHEHGLNGVGAQLADILDDTSRRGSGDDATLALAWLHGTVSTRRSDLLHRIRTLVRALWSRFRRAIERRAPADEV